MVIWPQNQLRADFLLCNIDMAYIATHPLTDSGETRDQSEPGSFLNDSEGREKRPWERG